MLILLFAHPHEQAHSFADVIEFEISHRVVNQIVHGGTIVLLGFLLVAHITAARFFGRGSLWVTAATTAFGAGCILMMASLVLDGFVVPALAGQFRATRDLALQRSMEALVRFCDIDIRTLMPLALLAFAISALAWCGPLVRTAGRSRIAGILSGLLGALISILMLVVAPAALNHALMAGLFLFTLWQLVLAFAFWNRERVRAP
jgi:hypothetical protein